jgi:hypothetical protein
MVKAWLNRAFFALAINPPFTMQMVLVIEKELSDTRRH